MSKILVYFQNLSKQHFLASRLKDQLWAVTEATSFGQVIEILYREKFDLILIDGSVNFTETLNILDLIKSEKLSVLSLVTGPFPCLNHLNQILEAGATEIISTAPSWIEVWLRLKNLCLLERKDSRLAENISIGTHYYTEGIIESQGVKIKLRQKENKILECLTKYQYRVLKRDELMKYVWDCPDDYPSPDTIDVYIRRLRIKLGLAGKAIKTYRGFGYRWEPEV